MQDAKVERFSNGNQADSLEITNEFFNTGMNKSADNIFLYLYDSPHSGIVV